MTEQQREGLTGVPLITAQRMLRLDAARTAGSAAADRAQVRAGLGLDLHRS